MPGAPEGVLLIDRADALITRFRQTLGGPPRIPFQMGMGGGRVHMRGPMAGAEIQKTGEYRGTDGRLQDQSLAEPRPAAEQTPLVPRAMWGGMRGVGGLRKMQDSEMAGSAKEAEAENVGGGLERLRKRLRDVQTEESRVSDLIQQFIAEEVAEELAREGRSWGDS